MGNLCSPTIWNHMARFAQNDFKMYIWKYTEKQFITDEFFVKTRKIRLIVGECLIYSPTIFPSPRKGRSHDLLCTIKIFEIRPPPFFFQRFPLWKYSANIPYHTNIHIFFCTTHTCNFSINNIASTLFQAFGKQF